MRTCKDCGVSKPLTSYYKNYGSFRTSCKDCYTARVIDYKKSPAKKPSKPESPKRRAKLAVENAISKGELRIHPCEACGSIRSIVPHHDDYDYPLHVRWFCSDHLPSKRTVTVTYRKSYEY